MEPDYWEPTGVEWDEFLLESWNRSCPPGFESWWDEWIDIGGEG